jgi:RNA polymerase sigma factor (sigma-70 family)
MPFSHPSPTDSALLRGALSGDVQALGALIERHFGKAYAVALARLRDAEVAEDLVQEVFLRVQLHLHQLGPQGNFPGWVVRIARNLSIDWLRRGQRASRLLPQVPLEEMASEPPDPSDKGAREIMAMDEESRALWKAIESLEPEQREILLLRHMEDLSQREIATQLGVDPSTVSRRLGAALKKLQRHLEPLLRQAIPRLRARRQAVSKSLTIAAAVGALSATAKASLVAAAPASQIASATSATKVGAAGAVGVIGFIQSLPTLIAGGAKVMATGKGIAAGITAVAAVTAGGIYLGTQGQGEAPLEPPVQTIVADRIQIGGQGFEREVSAVLVDDQGVEMHVELAQVPEAWSERLFDLSGDFTATATEFMDQVQVPSIPRVPGLRFHVPHQPRDPTAVGVIAHSYNLSQGSHSQVDVEIQTPEREAGDWDITLPNLPPGDLLVLQIVPPRSLPDDVWAVRLAGEVRELTFPTGQVYFTEDALLTGEVPELTFPSGPGAFVMGADGRWVGLRDEAPEAIERIWERSQQGEDVEALFAEMNLPVIPRAQEMIIVAPDLEWTGDETLQGAGFRFFDMESTELEMYAEDRGSGSGPWRVTFDHLPEGDALAIGWVHVTEGPQRMWLARLEALPSMLPPGIDHEGVFAVGPDGEVIELRSLSRLESEILRNRLIEGGGDAVFENMGVPTVPRSTRLLVLQPRSWYQNSQYGPGNGYEVALIMADGSSDGVEADYRDVLSTPGLMEITFPEIVEGGALAVARGNFSQGEVEVWMGRLE